MQQTLGGAEKYKEAFWEKLKEVREMGKNLTLTLPEAEVGCDASTAVFTNSGRNRVYTQKQPGLYSVHCHPVGGTPDPSLFVTYTRLSVRSQVQNFVSVRMSPSM